MKAFSEEWTKLFEEKINSNEEFKRTAHDWNSSLVLSMTSENTENFVFLNLQSGKCCEAKVAANSDLEIAEFIISANKESWQKILQGSLDPMMAVMTKKLELKKGNVGALIKNVEAAKVLIKTATQIETEF